MNILLGGSFTLKCESGYLVVSSYSSFYFEESGDTHLAPEKSSFIATSFNCASGDNYAYAEIDPKEFARLVSVSKSTSNPEI